MLDRNLNRYRLMVGPRGDNRKFRSIISQKTHQAVTRATTKKRNSRGSIKRLAVFCLVICQVIPRSVDGAGGGQSNVPCFVPSGAGVSPHIAQQKAAGPTGRQPFLTSVRRKNQAPMSSLQINGGARASAATPSEGAVEPANKKSQRVRINAFDSIRFVLIAYIVWGHFGRFADPPPFVLKAVSQINVAVGAFFALSGYVSAYTNTQNGERAPSPKLVSTPSPRWILSRVFGYYPLHFIVLLLFSPAFLYPDVSYNGWPTALCNGLMSMTLTQAWFPMHAEVWNSPTWFLSALTFATAVLPFSLPILSKMNKAELRRTGVYLFLTSLIPKLGYCHDHNAWKALEGSMSPKAMPNLAIFNTQRFNPFFATLEVLLGAVACRLVMLDGADEEKDGGVAPTVNPLSTLLPLVGMVGVILLRASGALELSDMLTRCVIFIPLFLRFLMAIHRASVVPKVKDPIVRILSTKFLVWLGGLSFPIFVVHGPIGQIFYKRITAAKLFGGTLNVVKGPWFFYVYLGVVMGSAWVLKNTVMSSKGVASISKKVVDTLSSSM